MYAGLTEEERKRVDDHRRYKERHDVLSYITSMMDGVQDLHFGEFIEALSVYAGPNFFELYDTEMSAVLKKFWRSKEWEALVSKLQH